MISENRLDCLTDKERRVATEFVSKVRERFGNQVLSIVLFGSRARGEAGADSDMDVLVVMSDDDLEMGREIRYLAVDVWLKHDIYLSTRVWSQDHWHKLEELQTLLYRNIRQDGISLWNLTPELADVAATQAESGQIGL
jgi:predicted nucleotidyltransferase